MINDKYLISQNQLDQLNGEFLAAAWNQNLTIMESLRLKGANPDFKNSWAMRISAAYGHLPVLQYLVEHGSDIHAFKDDVLCYASRNGHAHAVRWLVEQGADIHVRQDEPLRWRILDGHQEVVEYLVQKGASLKAGVLAAEEFNQAKILDWLRCHQKIREEKIILSQSDQFPPAFKPPLARRI